MACTWVRLGQHRTQASFQDRVTIAEAIGILVAVRRTHSRLADGG